MVNALLLLGVMATSPVQLKPKPFKIACLTDVVREVFPDKTYAISYMSDLEFAPVVYEFRNPVGTMKDVKNFCDALFLNLNIDEEKRTIRITKAPFLTKNDRITKVNENVELMRQTVQPFLKASPKEVLNHSRSISQANTLPRTADYDRNSFRSDCLDMLVDLPGRALLTSLLANQPNNGQLLSQPSRPNLQLPIDAEGQAIIQQYFTGKYFHINETVDRANFDDEEEWKAHLNSIQMDKEFARELGKQRAIPVIRIFDNNGSSSVELMLVTDKSSEPVSDIGVPYEWEPTPLVARNVPRNLLKVPTSFRKTGYDQSLNSWGVLAKDMNANYASWLSPDLMFARPQWSAEQWNRRGYIFDMKLENGWFTVYDPLRPLNLTSPSWRHFLKLKALHDGGDFAALLKYLRGLSDADLTGLENLGSQCSEVFSTSNPLVLNGILLSSGIRLYRIALPYLLSRPKDAVLDVTLSLNDLPPEQKGTYLGFFQSAYVWNNYLHLMHPTNVARINEVKLHIRFNPKPVEWREQHIELVMPEKWEINDSKFGFSLNDAEIKMDED